MNDCLSGFSSVAGKADIKEIVTIEYLGNEKMFDPHNFTNIEKQSKSPCSQFQSQMMAEIAIGQR